jgi:hypothetical protein
MSLFLMAATIAYAVGRQDPTGDQPRPEANTSAAIAGIIFIYRGQTSSAGSLTSR